jgi:hypothetical protein
MLKAESNGNARCAASAEGHETAVRLLLENGADINAQDTVYVTLAALSESSSLVCRLLHCWWGQLVIYPFYGLGDDL